VCWSSDRGQHSPKIVHIVGRFHGCHTWAFQTVDSLQLIIFMTEALTRGPATPELLNTGRRPSPGLRRAERDGDDVPEGHLLGAQPAR